MKNTRKILRKIKKVILITLAIIAALILIGEPVGEITLGFVASKLISLAYIFVLCKANNIID